MSIYDLYELLKNQVDDDPKLAKQKDVFVSMDFGDGKKSRIYEIDEQTATADEDIVLVVKAWQQ